MRRMIITLVFVLGVLPFFAAPLRADSIPMINLIASGNAPQDIININNLKDFTLTIDAQGNFTGTFRNNTGRTLKDLEFMFTKIETVPINGNGGTLFGIFKSTNSTLDFFEGAVGSGIAPGAVFTITGSGFVMNQGLRVTINGSVPEPSTLMLVGSGLLAALVRRSKRSHSQDSRVEP